MASRLLLLLIVASLCRTAVSQAPAAQDDNLLHPHWPSCSTADNYTVGSQFKKNLDQLLAALPVEARDNGWFYMGSAGAAGADQVFGLIMCYTDRNAMQCLDCLDRGPAGITKICPGSRRVSAAYDACLLRYSDTPFFSVADLSEASLQETWSLPSARGTRQSSFYTRQRVCRVLHSANTRRQTALGKAGFAECFLSGTRQRFCRVSKRHSAK
ncbi:hypothetical protein EJB05_00509, partial [Eragrostis curvula]